MPKRIALNAVLLSLFAFPAMAQDRGTITGVVTDASGASIPEARVSAENVTTGRVQSTETTAAGYYTLPELPVGLYTITVTKTGFGTITANGVRVVVNTATRQDFSLNVGQVTEKIEVQAESGLLQTDRSDLGSVLNSSQILELPLSLSGGLRSSLSFVTLTPGVYRPTTGDDNSIRIAGGQGRGSSMLLDGGETTTAGQNNSGIFSPVSVEAIQEFKVQTSSYSAEYGRTSNGIENFVTKSGTNQLHATGFEYLRNTAFNARGFYQKAAAITHQNDFGFTAGGPVYLPRVYDGRNKLFFFVAYEGSRYTSAASTGLGSVPTMAMRQGDFSSWVDNTGTQIPVYDPATTSTDASGNVVRTQFPGNVIPASRIDPLAKAVFALVPAPETSGLFNNIHNIGNPGQTANVWSTKIDWYAASKHRFALLLSTHPEAPPPQVGPIPGPLGNNWGSKLTSDFLRFNYDFIPTPTILNHMMFGISTVTYRNIAWATLRSGANQLTKSEWQTIQPKGVPIPDPESSPVFALGDGYPSLGSSVNDSERNASWELLDTVDIVKGSHHLKTGFEYYHGAYARNIHDTNGNLSFTAGLTGLPGASFQNGSSVASFLLGLASSGSYDYGFHNNWGGPYYAMFIQDDWKASRRLTVNMGLRYEIPEPPSEKYGNTSNLCFTCPNPAAGGLPGAIIFGGSGPGRNGAHRWTSTRKDAWGPRLGLAYQLRPNTVFRAGGGIYYAAMRFGQVSGSAMGFDGSRSFSAPNSFTPAFTFANGFPASAPPPIIDPTICTVTSSIACNPWYAFRYHGYAPRLGTWNAAIQHRFERNTTVSIAYQGNSGTGLFAWRENFNQLNPKYVAQYGSLILQPVGSPAAQAAGISLPYATFPSTLSVSQALRPFPQYYGFSNFADNDTTGHSTFHALELSAEHQLSHGLWFQVAYTWSKLISNAQYDMPLEGVFDAAGDVSTQNAYDQRADKAVSPDDTPHRVVLSYAYDLPIGRGRRFLNRGGVVNAVAGGWRLSGIQQYQTGMPLSVSSTQSNGVGTSERANLNSGVPLKNPAWNGDPNAAAYVNPAAFSRPPFLTFGNTAAVLSYLRSPGLLNEDFSLAKDFPLGKETRRLTFMANSFNTFNRVRFGKPNTTVESTAFGMISSQLNSPREIQFALRLYF